MLGKKEFLEALRDSPVIAAVKNPEGLQNCLTSDCSIAFVLYGDMLNIAGIVAQLKEAGKLAFVHIDLVDGLTSQDVVVDFIAKNTCADGIISTKHSLVRHAKGCGLLTVFIRYFGSYPEGVCYSIMIMNLVVALIDKAVKPSRFGVVKSANKEAAAK